MLGLVTKLVLGIERIIGTGAGASAVLVLRSEINLGGRIEPYGEFCLLLGRALLRDRG